MAVLRLAQTWRAWKWRRRFRQKHPALGSAEDAPERLRLVLGTARSGTSWLVETLAASATPMRYFHEPLFRYKPKLHLAPGADDHTAIAYRPKLSGRHPLVVAYRSLTVEAYEWPSLGVYDRDLRRSDKDWQVCLVKEVHSLLATEGLLRHFQVPTVLVVRDPVYVCDSIFDRGGKAAHYARREAQGVMQRAFLQRFLPGREGRVREEHRRIGTLPEGRERRVQARVLAVALLQEMLRRLADELPHAHLVSYEALCRQPEETFACAAAFLGLHWGERAQSFLDESMEATGKALNDPHSVYRNTSEQVERPFRYLQHGEADTCYEMLNRIGVAC